MDFQKALHANSKDAKCVKCCGTFVCCITKFQMVAKMFKLKTKLRKESKIYVT